MAFLLDTNVVSELRRRRPHPQVVQWFDRIPSSRVFLSVLVVGEIRQGIDRLRPRDPVRAQELEDWLGELLTTYGDRVVPVTSDIAQVWGRINAPGALPVVDGLLAATALSRGWTLVTRNSGDVAASGVRLLDPWKVAA